MTPNRETCLRRPRNHVTLWVCGVTIGGRCMDVSTTLLPGFSRRGFLAGAGAFSLALSLPVRAQSTLAIDRFMTVSARLCDTPLFSKTLGADILAILTHEFSDTRLRSLVTLVEGAGDGEPAFGAEGLAPLVSRLVAYWYSGLAPVQTGGERVLSYTDAAGWAATGYAKPPSYCGVAFGEWASAPDLSSAGN